MEGVPDALRELVPERAQMCLDSTLNPAGENEVFEIVEQATLANVAVHNLLREGEFEDTDEEDVSYLDTLTLGERLRSVVVVRHSLENEDCVDPRVMNSLRTVQRRLNLQRANSARQTRIAQYFNYKYWKK